MSLVINKIDANLIPWNIRTGVSIFWVNGSFTGAGAITGSSFSLANWVLSGTVPSWVYAWTETVTASDTNLLAANIKNGITIFGVTWTYSAVPPNGSNINLAAGSLTGTVPSWVYSGTEIITASDADLVASNIKAWVNIFWVTGTFSSGGNLSNGNGFTNDSWHVFLSWYISWDQTYTPASNNEYNWYYDDADVRIVFVWWYPIAVPGSAYYYAGIVWIRKSDWAWVRIAPKVRWIFNGLTYTAEQQYFYTESPTFRPWQFRKNGNEFIFNYDSASNHPEWVIWNFSTNTVTYWEGAQFSNAYNTAGTVQTIISGTWPALLWKTITPNAFNFPRELGSTSGKSSALLGVIIS